MHIEKVIIENFKCFEGEFSLDFDSGLNILVSDNEAGKSTILEAIHLALTGWFHGKPLRSELTQSLFNNKVLTEYLASLSTADKKTPPEILIELYFSISDDTLKALFEGNGNSLGGKACGLQFKISFNDKYGPEYEMLLDDGNEILSLPIEYYDFSWSTFARDDRLTPRLIPFKSAYIDSSSSKYQNGSDIYLSRIIKDILGDAEKVSISQAYRKMKQGFMADEAISDINKRMDEMISISDKKVEISVDFSTKSGWESSLATIIDGVPFQFIGKGEQSLIKTKLALSHNKSKEANVLLLEEPENHLSHSKLNKLIKHIEKSNEEKQAIVSTHSSFVANKLGLENLIVLNVDESSQKRSKVTVSDLDSSTESFFKKLPGYDTLRMVLCKKAILVEGPSDELVVQRAYKDKYEKLPIEDEIDVISVGTSFLRFLEVASHLKKPVVVVTDNDGNVSALENKYEDYMGDAAVDNIKICFDSVIDTGPLAEGEGKFNYNTLEPKLLKENDFPKFNKIFDTDFKSEDELHEYMHDKKTDVALKIFESEESITYPGYINEAIA